MNHLSAGFTDLLLGTDLVHVPRLKTVFSRHGKAFFSRLLTQAELAYCFASGKKESAAIKHAAGRIALKEAVSKALGSGLNGLGWSKGVSWQEIEIVARERQAPELVLHGKAGALAAQLNVKTWRISVSHDGDAAIATVIGLV